MFPPDGLLKTLRPWEARVPATKEVVVLLPFEPEMKMTPYLSAPRVLLRSFGSMIMAIRPGIADPPPRSLATIRISLPTKTARESLKVI
jgi:hypothetical protein